MRRHTIPLPLAGTAAMAIIAAGLTVLTVTTAGAASASGVSGKSAKQILAAVQRAEGAARGLHLHGTIDEAGEAIAFDLDVKHSGDGTGTFTDQGQTIKMIKLGSSLYLHANKAFWTKDGSAQLAKEIGDTWIKTSTTDADFGSLAQFFGVSRLTTDLFPSDSGPVKKGSPVVVDGYKTIPLTAAVTKNGKTTQTTTLYVAATGTPFVVKATAKSGSETGTITFTRYGETVTVKAPPKAITLSQLTRGTTTTTTAPATTTTTG